MKTNLGGIADRMGEVRPPAGALNQSCPGRMLHGLGAVFEITAGHASRFNSGYKGDYSRFFDYANLPEIHASDLGSVVRHYGSINVGVGLGIVAQQNKLMLWVGCQDSGNPVEFSEVLALTSFSELANPL